MQYLTTLMHHVSYVIIALIFMYVIKRLDDARTPFDEDYLIEEKCNLAVAFRRGGIYLGLAIAMVGVLGGKSLGFANDILALVAEGVFISSALLLAFIINDKIMLPGIKNDQEVEKGNIAVGLVEFGSYIATGFVINGAISGEGGGIISALAFFALGQIALTLMFYVYEIITPFSITEEVGKKANPAAGIALAGMLIALGIILRFSIAGPFTDWTADISSFAFSAIEGMALLIIFRMVVDKLFLPNTSLALEIKRDRNPAALVLTEAVIISIAVVIANTI